MFRILMFSAPVLAIVLIVVLIKMNTQETKMNLNEVKFEQEWAQEMKSFSKSSEERQFWDEKKKAAESELEEAKRAKAEADQLDLQQKKDMLDLKNDLDALGKDIDRDDLLKSIKK